MMPLSALKRVEATFITAAKKMLNRRGASTHPWQRLCSTANHPEHTLSSSRTHTSIHAIVELTNDRDHILWHAKTDESCPEEGSINGVVRFGKATKNVFQTPQKYIIDNDAVPGTVRGTYCTCPVLCFRYKYILSVDMASNLTKYGRMHQVTTWVSKFDTLVFV